MKTFNYCFFIMMLLSALSCDNAKENDNSSLGDFVTVKGLQYERQGQIIYIRDFEILDHPVTNLEYKAFIDATKYPSPLHWKKVQYPEEKRITP